VHRTFHETAEDELTAAYTQQYTALALMAEELHIPAEEADELIPVILLATLLEKPTGDPDKWLAGALMHGRKVCP
jgi:hypothetical protein